MNKFSNNEADYALWLSTIDNKQQVNALSTDELKKICSIFKLGTSGKRKQLIERVFNFRRTAKSQLRQIRNTSASKKATKNKKNRKQTRCIPDCVTEQVGNLFLVTDLPNEILFNILLYVDTITLLHCNAVCRLWRQTLFDFSKFWLTILDREFGCQYPIDMQRKLDNYKAKLLSSYNLDATGLNTTTRDNNSTTEKLQHKISDIITSKCYSCTIANIEANAFITYKQYLYHCLHEWRHTLTRSKLEQIRVITTKGYYRLSKHAATCNKYYYSRFAELAIAHPKMNEIITAIVEANNCENFGRLFSLALRHGVNDSVVTLIQLCNKRASNNSSTTTTTTSSSTTTMGNIYYEAGTIFPMFPATTELEEVFLITRKVPLAQIQQYTDAYKTLILACCKQQITINELLVAVLRNFELVKFSFTTIFKYFNIKDEEGRILKCSCYEREIVASIKYACLLKNNEHVNYLLKFFGFFVTGSNVLSYIQSLPSLDMDLANEDFLLVSKLLKLRADPSYAICAFKSKSDASFDIGKLLVLNGADLTPEGACSALSYAVQSGVVCRVQYLIDKADYRPVVEDVLWAVRTGGANAHAMLTILLFGKAKVDIVDSPILHSLIVSNASYDAETFSKVRELILNVLCNDPRNAALRPNQWREHSVNMLHKNTRPIHAAVCANLPMTVSKLIAAKANVNCSRYADDLCNVVTPWICKTNRENKTRKQYADLIFLAAEYGHFDCLNALLATDIKITAAQVMFLFKLKEHEQFRYMSRLFSRLISYEEEEMMERVVSCLELSQIETKIEKLPTVLLATPNSTKLERFKQLIYYMQHNSW